MQRRSLFEMIFGSKPKPMSEATTLRMLNGYTPFFSDFGNNAYDSDIYRGAVDAIARNAAKLKGRHIRRVNGQIQNTGMTMLERLLSVRPNPHMDAYNFLYKVVTQLYMKNNAFIMIDWDKNGMIRGFYPLNASTVEFVEYNREVYVKFRFLNGDMVTLPYSNVIHLRRFFYKNDIYGEPGETAIIPTLELISTTNQGLINAVKSSAFLRGLLKFHSMLKPEDMTKQRDAFIADYLNITNNGGIAATDAKADYVPLSNDPKMVDSKTMEFIEDKVYRYLGVSAAIVRSDYTEDQWNAFYESVIEPIALQLSLEFTSKVFTSREQGFGNEIVFEANRLQYASNTTKIALIEALIDRGLMTINEGREVFNLAPVLDGDKRLVSLNYVDASQQNAYQLGQNAPAADPPPDASAGGDASGTTATEPANP